MLKNREVFYEYDYRNYYFLIYMFFECNNTKQIDFEKTNKLYSFGLCHKP